MFEFLDVQGVEEANHPNERLDRELAGSIGFRGRLVVRGGVLVSVNAGRKRAGLARQTRP